MSQDTLEITSEEESLVNPSTSSEIKLKGGALLATAALKKGAARLNPKKSRDLRGLILNIMGDSETETFTVGMLEPENQVVVQTLADALDVPWRTLQIIKLSEEEFVDYYLKAYGIVLKTDGSEDGLSDKQVDWRNLIDFKTGAGDVNNNEESHTAPSLGEDRVRSQKELGDQILRTAVLVNASDVHFDMGPVFGMVRFRIDGVLYSTVRTKHGEFDFSEVDNKTILEVCMSIGASAGIDYNDMLNAPQDGSLVLKYPGPNKKLQKTRVRFASLPQKIETGDQRGVKVTLRINQKMITNIDELGLEQEVKEIIARGVQYIGGIGLICGGTGSGKTNILASSHTILRTGFGKNVMEYADTIEQAFPGICQTEVSQSCSEEAIIKAYLRHDPDAIIASEVRDDAATKQLVKIATAGKLVLSTLHTSSLPEVFIRLEQLGVDRYSQSQTLRFVVFTSLVRRLCPKCKKKGFRLRGVDHEAYEYFADEKGCAHCRFVGFRGRTSITEALCISPAVAEWIADKNLTGAQICEKAEKAGWLFPLNEAICRKIAQGITSKAEILRVIDIERRNSQHKNTEQKSKFDWREHPTEEERRENENQEKKATPSISNLQSENTDADTETNYIDMELEDGEENSYEANFSIELGPSFEESDVDELFKKIKEKPRESIKLPSEMPLITDSEVSVR